MSTTYTAKTAYGDCTVEAPSAVDVFKVLLETFGYKRCEIFSITAQA